MKPNHGISGLRKHALPWHCSCLLAALCVAGSTFAQQSPQPDASEAARHHGAASATYRVINLGPGVLYIAPPAINKHDHVAYTISDPLDWPRGWFYDGNNARLLGDLGHPLVQVTGMNDANEVTGFALNPERLEHAFYWSARRGIVDIGILSSFDRATGAAINRGGVVAGFSRDDAGIRAYRWSYSGGLLDLGALSGGPGGLSRAGAINDAGVIAGASQASSGWHLFRWTYGSGMVDIDTVGVGVPDPVAISAAGLIAGNRTTGDVRRGFVWTPGSGERPLAPGYGRGTTVTSMSVDGRIAGALETDSGASRALTWTQAGGLRVLGTLGGIHSYATAANTRGQVVGAAQAAGSGVYRGVVWRAREGMIDLNTRLRRPPAGLRIDDAVAISDNGTIVASSNAGLILLKTDRGQAGQYAVGPILSASTANTTVPFEASVNIAEDGASAPYRVAWQWDDGTTTNVSSTRTGPGQWRASARHYFATSGLHQVKAIVTNRSGRDVTVIRVVSVSSPDGGAGAGTFVSPRGAASAATTNADQARFNFVAPARNGAQAEPAKAGFLFAVGGLHFRSSEIQPGAPSGGSSRFEGSGTINNKGNYRFTLIATATDPDKGEPGRIRLRIWQVDPGTGNDIVAYDNSEAGARAAVDSAGAAAGSALTEGRIVLNPQ